MLNEILSYNRGQIIVDKTQLEKDCFLLDYDTELKLEMKTDSSILLNNRIYKLRLKRYIDSQRSNDNVLRFKSHYTYVAFKKIINMLEIDSKKRNYRFFVTDRLKRFISEKELFIDKRAQIGLAIKNRDEIVRKQYEDYKEIVDKEFERKLREKQMWDSFFMFTMKKCSNFSVPGSGKTASALGVYAYLHKKGLVKRIVMIGPINSFNSWIDEFKACFGGKQELSVFSIQNSTLHSTADKRRAIVFNTGGSNLILFNYESIGSFISEIEKLVSKDTLLIFDEIHKIKAIGGVRATYALEIARKASYIIAMTGTPIPNSYTDIRNLLEILFHDEYDDFFGFSMQQLKNPEEQDIQVMQTKARLVVLDPIQGFLGAEVDMHRANEIRPLMKRVAVLAEKYRCAIILIGHMNKNSNGKSSYRGLGSIDFQAAARSVLIVGRIKDEPEIRVVCHVKSSLAPEGKSIAFRLDKETGFEWIGEYDISADDLLSGDSRGQKSRKAKEFLLEILANGGMAQKKIEEEAENRGIKKKTLRNAKLELEIDSVKRGNQWFWMLSE